MGYWKSKVLPKIKKVFEKNGTKKSAAAAEACKSFDESKVCYLKSTSFYLQTKKKKKKNLKTFFDVFIHAYVKNSLKKGSYCCLICVYLVQEQITKEFEEKKTELQPKVLEIYEASSVEIKVR